jgi:hypothetical protein
LGDCTIAIQALLRRFDRRLLISGSSVLAVLLLLGYVGYMLRPFTRDSDSNFYTPGVTPNREDCVISKMKNYAKIDRMVMQSIAQECELTVQSIEGHEKLRKAWEERQAIREATPKPAATPEPAAPAESDRLRRVWR